MIEKEVDPQDVSTIRDISSQTELSSAVVARMYMKWLIGPISTEDFYEKYWEKQPLCIRRKCPSYYDGWFSKTEMERIFREHSLTYGEEVDLTKYIDGQRFTLNPTGTATSQEVWKQYEDGCSVRLLRPQRYSDELWKLLSILEEEWNCMAGSNVYLTPKGTQGFAPHYDDIEAFLLQVEGKKYWKVYAPMDESSVLPRVSSANFKPEDLLAAPVFQGWLEPGDLLYFPRGYIHQGYCSPEVHSLHVTISTAQQNSWGDFMELLLPTAMKTAIASNVEMRQSLPRDYFNYIGAMHSEIEKDARRTSFFTQTKKHMKSMLAEALTMLDSASDQMACKFLQDRLPPVLNAEEEECSAEGTPTPKIKPDTNIRLLRQGIVRLAIEGGKAVVYHSMENSRQHHEMPLSPLEYELDDAPSIEMILINYPDFVRVGDLPHDDDEDKVELVKSLFAEGILMFEKE